MIKRFYILKFFFCVAVLTLLTACGGGGGAGEGVADDDSCNPLSHFCDTPDQIERATCANDNANPNNNIYNCENGEVECDNSELFCHTTEAVRADCEPRSHDCGKNNRGTGIALDCSFITHFCATSGIEKATCATKPPDNSIYNCDGDGKITCDNTKLFCHSTKAERDDCDPATHNCETGALITGGGDCDNTLKFCNTPDEIVKATCNDLLFNCGNGVRLSCDELIKICDENSDDAGLYVTGGVDDATDYEPPNTEPPPDGGWVAALATARETHQYNRNTSADQIGAAYAHARGYTGMNKDTGNSVIVSHVGLGRIAYDNGELEGQLVDGYVANDDNSGTGAGQCSLKGERDADAGSTICSDIGTHIAGIIAGKKGGGGSPLRNQGIAYNAKIKPITIYGTDDNGLTTSAKRAEAIKQASGPDIAVMHNSWNIQIEEWADTTTPYYRVSTQCCVDPAEIAAWVEAVKNTVVVFPAGDNGLNTVNGISKVYSDKDFNTHLPDEVISYDEASKHAILPSLIVGLKGKWLSVIALDPNNRIADFSNGCGRSKDWCLGAPGETIYSAYADGRSRRRNGTDVAAAHVSAAVAILAGAFPNLDPDELVSLILDTADYIYARFGDDGNTNEVYGHGALNLARASEPIGPMTMTESGNQGLEAGITIDNSGITLPTSFGGALTDLTAGFTDDYNRAFIGTPARIAQQNIAFTLDETMASWDSPELQNIQLDSNSKMQFTNYDESEDAKDTLIFTHNLPNHTIGFSYNEEHKTPDLMLADKAQEMHFQKIRPIASDLMQVNSTHKLGGKLTVKNAITSGEFDTGNRFNEAMTNLNYAGENRNLTIGAGTLQEYGQFLGASGTGAYQLSDATQSTITHLAVTQNLPRNSAIKLKYTGFKTEVDMRYSNFANINDLTADEYQLSFGKKQVLGKHDSIDFELIQPLAITDGNLQQSTVIGYNAEGGYNNVVQNYTLTPANRRQQVRMTWQNLVNLERKTRLFISMQYENHVDNLRDNEDSSILGGISTKF